MAYALPVVSSDLESVRPFIRHGIDSMLVVADDPAGHASALLRLLQTPADAERMGAAGQNQIVTRFNWSAMEPRFLALVNEVLDRHANRFS
jgi:glycosyltransferase involved in cell wall biosynthesis